MSLFRYSFLFRYLRFAFFLSVAAFQITCASPIREAAPGQDLPALNAYDVSEALVPRPIDTVTSLRVQIRFSTDVDAGLRLRLLSLLRSEQRANGPLVPWSASFAESDGDRPSGFSHRILFQRNGDGVKATSFMFLGDSLRELSTVDLTSAESSGVDDGGFDLSHSGQPLPLESRPPLRISDESKQMLTAFVERLGMGTLRISSPSKADVFLRESGKTIALGVTPVEVPVRAGIHEILMRRHGQPDQVRSIRVMDGGERLLLASWSDDSDPGSALIYTSPGGYRLALDGEVIGEAPVARPGILAGVYDLEIALKSGSADYSVIAQDRLQIIGGRRSDRFYPFEYYLPLRGESLQTALDGGLWTYTSKDGRFSITDFHQPSVVPLAGVATIPIGTEDLQLEAVLPDGSASFGIYSENDRFLVEPAADALRLRLERQGKMEVYTLPRTPGKQIYVLADVDRKDGTLVLRVNGSTFYSGPFASGQYVRFLSIGLPNGTLLPEEIIMRSGSESGGFIFRLGRAIWYRAKAMSGSPLRLREEQK